MMNQARLAEIATGLQEASAWVQGARKNILIGYAEEIGAAAGEQDKTPPPVEEPDAIETVDTEPAKKKIFSKNS